MSGFSTFAIGDDVISPLPGGTPLFPQKIAPSFGVSDRYDPRQNVLAGAQYLRFLMARFGLDAIRPATAAARQHFRGERARALFAGLFQRQFGLDNAAVSRIFAGVHPAVLGLV